MIRFPSPELPGKKYFSPESGRGSKTNPAPCLITGTRAFWLRQFLKLYFIITALTVFRNPFRGLKALMRLQSYRQSFEGKKSIMGKFVRAGRQYFFASDSPGFPGAAFRELMKNECKRRSDAHSLPGDDYIPVQTVFWGITNRCPLQCVHCYDWDNIDTRDRLGVEQLMGILDIFRKHGIRHIQLSGGEPMARFEDLTSIVKAASPDMECWLLTSAYGFSESRARALKDSGLLGVNISLDHWQEEKHNDFRKHNQSFQWAMQAIEHGRKAGLLVSLSLCVTREMASWENLMEYAILARNRGVHFVRMLEPREVGRFSGRDVRLDPAQVDLISRFVRQMNAQTQFRDFPVMVFFGYHQRILGCMGAGDRYLYVDANGDMHACPFCRGSMGNLLELPYREILQKVKEGGCHLFSQAFY
jgi:MoaA/NifB/PqqE/SkfB family radical SAM enzyme